MNFTFDLEEMNSDFVTGGSPVSSLERLNR